MRKSTITILAIIMGVSFLSLLAMQVFYIREIHTMHKEQFDENANRSLQAVAHQLEIDETVRYIESKAISTPDTLTEAPTTEVATHSLPDQFYTRRSNNRLPNSLQQTLKQRYRYGKELVEEVVIDLVDNAHDMPLEDRIDFNILDQTLKAELSLNGINAEYHYQVLNGNGDVVYQCPDYNPKGKEGHTFTVQLFKNDPIQNTGQLAVHFPEIANASQRALWFLMPSLIFTFILLATFIITLTIVFRQKKLAEVKNDFINNMTHEFKTPISSISLAAQMLNDDSVKKSETLSKRLSATIMDETKRLRFQVDKVLQLSLYDNQNMNYNLKEIDTNELLAGVIHTFTLKVEKNGGKIIPDIQSENPFVLADEMHLTNVIFNLMDNAVKYCRKEVPLELKISSWNEQHILCIAIKDNGQGIKKEDIKKIFDKFYRVHTGNVHDVKGFGLGLAYVKKIITDFKGTIQAESEPGFGTTFIIHLPVCEDN